MSPKEISWGPCQRSDIPNEGRISVRCLISALALINILSPSGKGHCVVFGKGRKGCAGFWGVGVVFLRRAKMGARRTSTMSVDMSDEAYGFVLSPIDGDGNNKRWGKDVAGTGSWSRVSAGAVLDNDVSYEMVASSSCRDMMKKSRMRSRSFDGTLAIHKNIVSTLHEEIWWRFTKPYEIKDNCSPLRHPLCRMNPDTAGIKHKDHGIKESQGSSGIEFSRL